ncbi:MAG: HRDC domain-containing protein, partial [Acidimicrobiales bacterium]
AAPPRRPATDAATAEPFGATIGATFTHRSHDHEVVEITDRGVVSIVDGGPARTTIAYGTGVSVGGRPVLLAQPRFAESWERLRAWRSERARAAGKPAFVVFDDKTLRLVAASLPTDEAGLLAISGIGPVKLEAYGDDLIAIADQLRAGSAT